MFLEIPQIVCSIQKDLSVFFTEEFYYQQIIDYQKVFFSLWFKCKIMYGILWDIAYIEENFKKSVVGILDEIHEYMQYTGCL